MTGCVYVRQVYCSFNSQGQELSSLPVCHAKGGPYLAAMPLLSLTGASTMQAGALSTAGHTCTCRGSTASTDRGLPFTAVLQFSIPNEDSL